MIITVASGKGGTGKTSISTALALVMEKSLYVDMDAEEPNGHIVLKPEIKKSEDFKVPVPYIDPSRCTFCGMCSNACRYGALAIVKKTKKIIFFKELCHNCGVCSFVCPVEGAITEKEEKKGIIRYGRTVEGVDFIDSTLEIGEGSSTQLLEKLNKIIERDYKDFNVIIDSAPGTNCPVVEAIKNSNFVVLVTEPTIFGLNDLKLIIEFVKSIDKPFGIVINKQIEKNRIIHDYAEKEGVEILGEIPFSRENAFLCSQGKTLIDCGFEEKIREISIKIINMVKKSKNNFSGDQK